MFYFYPKLGKMSILTIIFFKWVETTNQLLLGWMLDDFLQNHINWNEWICFQEFHFWDSSKVDEFFGCLLLQGSHLLGCVFFGFWVIFWRSGIPGDKNIIKVIQSALLGMLKWPFQRLLVPSNYGIKRSEPNIVHTVLSETKTKVFLKTFPV